MGNEQVLLMENVRFEYKNGIILDDIDISIHRGELMCLLGRSGSGKSTLLKLIAGFISPSAGHIYMEGREVTAPSWERGVIFQEPVLYEWLNVYDNVAFGLRMRKKKNSVSEETIRERVTRCLQEGGLTDYAKYYPYELSGGMKQRVALSRVLVNRPKMMLMDEPFSALDPVLRKEMHSLLLKTHKQHEMAVLFVTHDIHEAISIADRILILAGKPGYIVGEICLKQHKALRQNPNILYDEIYELMSIKSKR